MNRISMVFKQLIIVGVNKEYVCKFDYGLNLIWGDMDSGKSSILNLIDYALGGGFNELQLDYDELRSKGRYIQLEVEFNNKPITLERVLGTDSNIIKLYHSERDNISNVYPLICGASSSSNEPDGWISDAILDLLGIPKVKIKESKKSENTNSDRLSFRDLMKLIYLKQKKVANDTLMDAANPYVHNKNIEVQKFIYGVHDDQLSELNQQLKHEIELITSLKTQVNNIRDFLKSTSSLSVANDEYESLSIEINKIDEEICKLKSNKTHASIVSNKIKLEIDLLQKEINKLINDIEMSESQLKIYSKLKTTYSHDITCLKASKKMRGVLTVDEMSKKDVSCPMCHSEVKLSDPTLDNDNIDYEINSLKNRLSGCDASISIQLEKIKENVILKDALNNNLSEIRIKFDTDNIEKLSPTIDAISRAESIKRSLVSHYAILKKNMMLTKKLDEKYTQVESREINVGKIKAEISKVEENLGSIDDVLTGISSEFKKLINQSKLTNNYGASIDSKFMPIFRGRKYSHISSGGVRTILSVNLYLARLRYILENGAYLPTTLLLDTPGQNIGRYARLLDMDKNEENLSDPSIYEGIYMQLKAISELANGNPYQIIVVDNDLPNCLDEDNYNLVKRFDKSDSQYEKGLINDM
ncbi:AAA family ATPase [Aliivibrio sp. S4TY2]|uniref:AAA family ATPase n=2 Tax=Aliivibrio TaxID=511678 RepID=UPI002379C675|nr:MULTISPECIES: AAA family ATPase [unclassified Aliivibrio]MDD9156970.1 AAA family ATPase [Aliivibrio sp. S4TY2]MDD9160816.1 AAA family ATPase [Aliivibrio sp. S4TY1]MDD9168880.1 AAA family ATPase [Aliivibrio sp. S4MY4]MDD9185408.1 AAA family ATPase [Aliivibrio sp. S4MY3]MDD9203151.1 AAA family ATPase [Aliivibrio sp. S4MY1]